MYFSSLPFLLFLPLGSLLARVACVVAAVLLTTLKVGFMTVCLHRYLAHGAFKCGPFMNLVVQVMGCLSNQGSPIWWASKHRAHHKFCETDRDPHSPTHMGVLNAFHFSNQKHKDVDEEFAPTYADGYLPRVLSTWCSVPSLIELLLAWKLLGPTGLWLSFVSGFLSQNLALWFNVLNHPPKSPEEVTETEAVGGKVPSACCAKDEPHRLYPNVYFAFFNMFVFIGTLNGETNHGHHHNHSQLAQRPGVDYAYQLAIRPMAALGLISKCKLPQTKKKAA